MKNKSWALAFVMVLNICAKGGYAQSTFDSSITVEKLKEVVYHLANDSLVGRPFGSWACDSAANYIADQMQAAGLKKLNGLNGYLDDFGEEFKSVRNVMGVLPGTGKKSELVIISAHYDHLGVTEKWKPKTKRDEIFNGANDDASGVAVMLALARYFAGMPHQRTIVFIAFSGEEAGMWGSRAFSSILKKPELVTAQINLEMLGRPDKGKQPFITGHWHSDLRDILNKTISDSLQITSYFQKDNSGERHLFLRSDNFPLARLGIPAHTIMLTNDTDPYYHTTKDEAATLDYPNMCTIARNIALAITPLIEGIATPRRINPNSLPASFY